MTERYYHLNIRREKDGRYLRLTQFPMQHAECVTMKSKFSPEEQSRILFAEVEVLYEDEGSVFYQDTSADYVPAGTPDIEVFKP